MYYRSLHYSAEYTALYVVQQQHGEDRADSGLVADKRQTSPLTSVIVNLQKNEQKKKKNHKEEQEENDQKAEDTQTMQNLIAQLSSNPNKSEAEQAKFAALLEAQNKMFELGVSTKDAVKLVPELWKF